MRTLILVALFAASCAKGESILELTVSTSSGTLEVGRIELTVNAGGRSASPVTHIVNGTIPPAQKLALRFAADVSGRIDIDARALDSDGSVLASTSGAGEVRPSEVSSTTLLFLGEIADMTTPRDMAPDLAPVRCNDPVSQDPCPSGTKCIVSGGRCDPDGTRAIGSACVASSTASDNCVRGSYCSPEWSSTTTSMARVCKQFCFDDGDCSGSSGPGGDPPRCVLSYAGVVKRCTTPCNPVQAAGGSDCPTGMVCRYDDFTTTGERTDCAWVGTVAVDAVCATTDECQAWLTCVPGSVTGMKLCRKMCRLNTAGDCTGGYSCRAYTGATVYGHCCPSTGC